MNDLLRLKIEKLPTCPGCYLMKSGGKIIYVGKAVNLKNRVSQYFHASREHTVKVRAMVERIDDFDIVLCDTNLEALILECNLIKLHRPQYNILLKDDKHYPYLRIDVTQDYPRVELVRRVQKDKARYFGPYMGATGVREVLDVLRGLFPLRTCAQPIRPGTTRRPCLHHQVGECLAPCAGLTTPQEYGKYMIQKSERFEYDENLEAFYDYEGYALQRMNEEDGMFTDRGYIAYKGGVALKKVIKDSQGEQPAPEPWRGENRDEMLRMTLYAKNKAGYSLVLPADEEYLSAAKSYLGVGDFAEAVIRDVRFKVPYIGELVCDTDCPSVEEYNEFAEAMESIWQKDGALLTYAAVLDAERPDTLGRAYELLQNLENYERIVEGTYGYGQQRLQETLGLDDEAIYKLVGYMDFEKYGKECMEADGVVTTEFGLLRRLEPPFAAQTLQMRDMV